MGYGWKMGDAVDLAVGITRQALSDIVLCGAILHAVTLQADDDNSGNIWVGGSAVAVGRGNRLVAGQVYSSPASEGGLDIATMHVIASAEGQTLHITFWESGSHRRWRD